MYILTPIIMDNSPVDVVENMTEVFHRKISDMSQ